MFRRSKPHIDGQVFIDGAAQFKLRIIVVLIILVIMGMLIFDHFVTAVVLMLIILILVIEERETTAFVKSIKVEDDRSQIYPYVGEWINYELFIQSKANVNNQLTLTLRISQGDHYFSNHHSLINYTIDTSGVTKLDIPIYINSRGTFKVIIENIKIPGIFNIQHINFVPNQYLSTLFCAYGTYKEQHIHTVQHNGQSNDMIIASSTDKYANIVYDYSQPFNQLDWPASLKAQQLMIKQTEMPVQKKLILSLNVGTFNHVNRTVEQDLQAFSHIALTLFAHGDPFLAGINTKESLTSVQPSIIYITDKTMKDQLHRLIATFSQDSYIMPYTRLIEQMYEVGHEAIWYHFGTLDTAGKKQFEQLHIQPEVML